MFGNVVFGNVNKMDRIGRIFFVIVRHFHRLVNPTRIKERLESRIDPSLLLKYFYKHLRINNSVNKQ